MAFIRNYFFILHLKYLCIIVLNPLFKKKFRWKPPIKLSDCSSEYLQNCPVDYSLLENPFASKPDVYNAEQEAKLWQGLGILTTSTSVVDGEKPPSEVS